MTHFEERLKKLEELGVKIQQRDVSLEDALQCFEEGIKLARGMEEELEKIEGKVQQLMNGSELETGNSENTEEESRAKTGKKRKGAKAEPVFGLFEPVP